MQMQAIANYTHELGLFQDLIDSGNQLNILMLQGESGSGKSHFIEHCLKLDKELRYAHIKLENGGESVTTLFNVLGSKIGRQSLPNFNETLADLVGEPMPDQDSMWQMKLRRHLREIGKTADLPTKLSYFQLLTDGWFADALNFEQPMLLAIDTYEKRSTEFENWLREEFLYGVAHTSKVNIIIGGQSLPATDAEWEAYSVTHQLKGVSDPQDWLAWGEQVGLELPSADVIMGICLALKGNPSAIVETLQSQAVQKDVIEDEAGDAPSSKPKLSFQYRKRIRQNIIEGFTLSEIKDLCYDLDIDYEILPDHDHKTGLARELIGYLGRNNRLEEFIDICQEERPELVWGA